MNLVRDITLMSSNDWIEPFPSVKLFESCLDKGEAERLAHGGGSTSLHLVHGGGSMSLHLYY